MIDDNDDANKRGTFLKVEKTQDSYIETDQKGDRTRYFRMRIPQSITVENLQLHTEIDPHLGSSHPKLYGATRENIRAIGVTGDYPVFDVVLMTGARPGQARIVKRYASDGHSLHSAMIVEVSEDAASNIATALRGARAVRVLSLHVEEGFFWGSTPDAHVLGHALLLPWLGEHKKTAAKDEVVVEFEFRIISITVEPEYTGWLMRPADYTEKPKSTAISGSVGVHYSSDKHPLLTPLHELQTQVTLLRTSLTSPIWAAAVAIIVFIVHRW